MASIRFETEYDYLGEYFSPGILINIAKQKLSKMTSVAGWLLFPIRLILFLICFFYSICCYPIYLITKLFYLLNEIDNSFVEFIMWLINIFYLIVYYAYIIIIGFHHLLCFLYCLIPPQAFVLQKKAIVKRDEFYY